MVRERYVVEGLLCLTGFVGGVIFGIYSQEPQTAYEKKVEDDEREYLIIETNVEDFSMVRTAPNEPFRRLEVIFEEKLDSERVSAQSLRKKLSEK